MCSSKLIGFPTPSFHDSTRPTYVRTYVQTCGKLANKQSDDLGQRDAPQAESTETSAASRTKRDDFNIMAVLLPVENSWKYGRFSLASADSDGPLRAQFQNREE